MQIIACNGVLNTNMMTCFVSCDQMSNVKGVSLLGFLFIHEEYTILQQKCFETYPELHKSKSVHFVGGALGIGYTVQELFILFV